MLLSTRPKIDFEFATKNLGILVSFTYTAKNEDDIPKILGKKISEASPEEFIKALMPLVCFKKTDVVNEEKPEKPLLKDEDLNKLLPEDIEEFASLFLDYHDYLYKESKTESDISEIKHPKDDNESCLSYLHRLMTINEKMQEAYIHNIFKIAKEAKKSAERLNSANPFGFYSALAKAQKNRDEYAKIIQDRINLSSALSQAVLSQQEIGITKFLKEIEEPANLKKIAQGSVETSILPFKPLYEGFKQLNNSVRTTEELLTEIISNQASIVDLQKIANNNQDAVNTKIFNQNRLIIFIAVLTLIFSLATGIYSIIENRRLSENTTKALLVGMEKATSSLEAVLLESTSRLSTSLEKAAIPPSKMPNVKGTVKAGSVTQKKSSASLTDNDKK